MLRPGSGKIQCNFKSYDLLKENGLDYELYSDIKPNPTIENVQHGVQSFKDSGADYLIAIGGGSSMDTSKASVLSSRTRNLKMSEVSKVWLRPKNLAYRSSPYLPQPELLRK